MDEICIEELYSAFNRLNMSNDFETNNNDNCCVRCGSTDFQITNDGDNVCTGCGVAHTSGIINEGAEWNNFNSEHNERCEYNNTSLLHSDNMSTQISFKRNMKPSDWGLMRWQRTLQLSSKDRSLIKVYNKIDNCCAKHNIPDNIIVITKTLYKFVSMAKLSRGAVREAMLASCLYYAWIQSDNPRNIEEVSTIFNANPKKVNKTNKILASFMWKSNQHKQLVTQNTSCEHIIYRYCNKIDISPRHIAQITKLCNEYETRKNMIGKDSSYIAALAIYNYSKSCDLHISKDDICDACFLSTVTLNKLLKNEMNVE